MGETYLVGGKGPSDLGSQPGFALQLNAAKKNLVTVYCTYQSTGSSFSSSTFLRASTPRSPSDELSLLHTSSAATSALIAFVLASDEKEGKDCDRSRTKNPLEPVAEVCCATLCEGVAMSGVADRDESSPWKAAHFRRMRVVRGRRG